MTLFDDPTLLDPTLPDRTGPGARRDDPAILLARAAFLREVAVDVEPLVATSIRRRASELELTAWVLDVRAGT